MKCLLPCAAGLLMFTPLLAADVDGPCVTLESPILFRISDVVAHDRHLLERYPEVTYSDDEAQNPVRLTWKIKEHTTACESAKMAEVGGREIWRFVFWHEDGRKTGDGILCVWLGIETQAPAGGRGFQPFLVLNGDDQISSWECFTAYDEEDKFTIHLRMHLKGNGVFWTTAIVQLRPQGPVPLRQESGGRGREVPEIALYRPAHAR